MNAPAMNRRDYRTLQAAAEELHSSDPEYRRAVNLDFLVYVLSVVLIALSLRAFIGEPVRVDGPSMLPTLQDTEYMLAEKVSYYFHPPERGDIAIVFYPGFTVSCVKRVIALPGERISIYDGKVYINGEELDESEYWNDYIEGNMKELTVPENTVFVMGDNRNISGDSRMREVGPIPFEKVLGKVRMVMWPFGSFRAITHGVY